MFKKTFTFFVLAALLIASGCSGLLQGGKTGRDPKPNLSTPGFIIDAHLHYRATDQWEESFLEIYPKWNAMAIILVRMNDLDRGIAFAKDHPDWIIPYAAINIDSPSVAEDIRKAHDMGFRGLGELFAVNDWNYDDPKYNIIWEMAERLQLPVLPHTGIHATGQLSRMRPGYLGTIAARYPNLIIHAAHFGNPWYDEAGEIARRCPNVYFDITGSSLIKKANEPWIWGQYLWWSDFYGWPHMPRSGVPALQKLVFATDEAPTGLEENILRFNRMLDALGADEETRKMCYYGTMAKIHNIDISKYIGK